MGEVQPSRCEDKERFSDIRDAGVKRRHVKTAEVIGGEEADKKIIRNDI